MDKKDRRILHQLDYDARMPLTELADAVGLSKQTCHYRLDRLQEEGVIRAFKTVIDVHKLGHLTYRAYIRYQGVGDEEEPQIIEYFNEHEKVLWFVSLLGSWDAEVVFTAENFIQFSNLFKQVKEEIGEYFHEYELSMSVVNHHLNRDYLLDADRGEFESRYYGYEPSAVDLDELDIRILRKLSQNCRQSNMELGRKLDVTYHTVKDRIERMERDDLISGHRIHIDLDSIERTHYKANMTLDNPGKEEEQELYSYCNSFNIITYLVEVLGQRDFEVEIEAESQSEFTETLRKIRNRFPALIQDYDILQVTDEHRLDYFPKGIADNA